jgi:hypothetical protein
VSGVTLPTGFITTQSWPLVVAGRANAGAPPGEASMMIQLDDEVLGPKSGRVTIQTNDADEGQYDFAVTGNVTGNPAAVQQLFIGSTGWNRDFRDYLDAEGTGSDRLGFELPATSVAPWVNLNQLSLRFDLDVRVEASDLVIRGAGGSNYASVDFFRDSADNTATWILASALGNDRFTVSLAPDVLGVPFELALNVLPGDVNRNGVVLADDLSAVKRSFFRSTNNPGIGDDAYSIFRDLDGSGSILANDFSEVKRRFFNRLPEAQVVAPEAVVFGQVLMSVGREGGAVLEAADRELLA